MNPKDVTKLIEAVNNARDRALILLLLRTGMRIGEALGLTVNDIDLKEKKVRLMEGEKNNRGRVVYLASDATFALKRWLSVRNAEAQYLFYGQRGRLSHSAARSCFVKYLKKARLDHKGYTVHCLRHYSESRIMPSVETDARQRPAIPGDIPNQILDLLGIIQLSSSFDSIIKEETEMIDQFYSFQSSGKRLRLGPLGPYIDAFAQYLSQQGYAKPTARHKIRAVAGLSRWLEGRQCGVEDLDEQVVSEFLRYRRRKGLSRCEAPPALRALLSHLRDAGIIPCAPGREESPFHAIEQRFAQYLTQERGLAKPTIDNYLPIARTFLSGRFGGKPIILDEITPRDITGFHRAPCEKGESAARPTDNNRSAQLVTLSPSARRDPGGPGCFRSHCGKPAAVGPPEVS